MKFIFVEGVMYSLTFESSFRLNRMM